MANMWAVRLLTDVREPVSSLTHFAWMLLAMPAAVILWRAARGNRLKQAALSVYAGAMIFCYAASTLYHGVRSPEQHKLFTTLDYIGIFLLIAGTVTPVALVILRGPWRWGLFLCVWSLAAVGITLRVAGIPISRFASTGLYIGMGWAVLLCYFELVRVMPPRSFRFAVLGGVLYTAGAMLNHAQWPLLWPGVFSAHEIFHLFVMAASVSHFWFMLSVVAPFQPRSERLPACSFAVGTVQSNR